MYNVCIEILYPFVKVIYSKTTVNINLFCLFSFLFISFYSICIYIWVWIVRPRIFQPRTELLTIRTSISLKQSYQSHRCTLYLIPLSVTLFGLKTAMWLIAFFQRYWSTNPGSLRPGAKDCGPWNSHTFITFSDECSPQTHICF